MAVDFVTGFGKGFFNIVGGFRAKAGFLLDGIASTLTGGLETLTALATGMAAVFTTAFGVDLTDGFTSDLDGLAALPTTLAAGLPFFVAFTFTTGLL